LLNHQVTELERFRIRFAVPLRRVSVRSDSLQSGPDSNWWFPLIRQFGLKRPTSGIFLYLCCGDPIEIKRPSGTGEQHRTGCRPMLDIAIN
jgi:hypothetical protein